MKDGLDGKKNARQIRGCQENGLIQSFDLLESRPDPEARYKRGIGVVGQTHQAGAFFEALNERVLMAPLDLPCIFFTIQTILHEHSAESSHIN